MELTILDVQDPKLEEIFGIIHKLIRCSEFKQKLLVELVVSGASENGKIMEFDCLIGLLISISILANDDMSNISKIILKVVDKVKACKTKNGYNKTVGVRFI